ncbi:MAG: C40 family peptidase [Bacteroides sp.]|jgi:cell wall-associated NlpC family hydrolase|nr:C40 family peptidase [Bacteroides sp.]
MKQGICLLSVAGLRSEPDSRSELVSQLVFGDLFEIVDDQKDWLQIRMLYDHYLGWVSANQVQLLTDSDFSDLQQSPQTINTDLIKLIEDRTQNTSFPIGAGSTFYFYEAGNLSVAGKVFQYNGAVNQEFPAKPSLLTEYALLFLNTPYLWGGRSPFGIDCSGFMQLVFKMGGIKIPRDAAVQATQGDTIHLINEALPGDLLFFDNEEQQITHVGMLINEGHIIHAHGKVRVDLIDHNGIFSRDIRRYTHSLRLIKRIKPNPNNILG